MSQMISGTAALIATYLLGVLGLAVAVWIGRRLGAWQQVRARASAAPMLTLQGSAMALLALMLGFTFSAAVTRYDARKAAVLGEANAIGTAYLRTDLLPAPSDKEAAGLLRRYAALRVAPTDTSFESFALGGALDESARLQATLWKIAVTAAKAQPDSRPVGMFVQALNDVIDMHTVRVTAARNHIPDEVLVVLCVLAAVSMGLAAYYAVIEGKRSQPSLVVMSLLTAGVLAIIIDMDHPWIGFLRIDQTPLTELLQSMGPAS